MDSQPIQTTPAIVDTPARVEHTGGEAVPGAFPGQEETAAPSREQLTNAASSAGSTIAAAGATVASYLPAKEDVTSTLSSAGQTAASYIPENVKGAVAGYIPGLSSSKAEKPAFTSSAGVGDLPGSASATDVAVLPAERQTMPTSMVEQQGAQPHDKSDGVGSLPGHAGEEGVVRKLEETANTGSTGSSNSPTPPAPATNTELKPNLVGVDTASQFVNSQATKPEAVTTENKSEGGDSNTLNTSHNQQNTSTSEATAPTQTSDANVTDTATSRSPGKVGFMTKLKGGVKVVQGKLSNNEEKIEEGRRIRSGDV